MVKKSIGIEYADPSGETLALHFEQDSIGRIPYPFHIDVGTGEVGRQDVWQGDPQTLIGFTHSLEQFEVALTQIQWTQNPALALRMFPIFENSLGQWGTYPLPVNRIS